MGYANVTGYANLLFPVADRWAIFLAAAAVVAGFALRSRLFICFTLLALFAAVVLVFDPIGSLYNVRVLPLWFLSVYLLAAWVVAAALTFARGRGDGTAPPFGSPPSTTPAACWPGSRAGRLRGGGEPGRWPARWSRCSSRRRGRPAVRRERQPLARHRRREPGERLAAWNYSGSRANPPIPSTAPSSPPWQGRRARFGCGRAMWEYNADLNRFGTPWPSCCCRNWTGDCIDSMEGWSSSRRQRRRTTS